MSDGDPNESGKPRNSMLGWWADRTSSDMSFVYLFWLVAAMNGILRVIVLISQLVASRKGDTDRVGQLVATLLLLAMASAFLYGAIVKGPYPGRSPHVSRTLAGSPCVARETVARSLVSQGRQG